MRVAIIQLNSQDDVDANVEAITAFIDQAATAHKSDFVALPEYAICLTSNRETSTMMAQDLTKSSAIDAIAQRARVHSIYIHLGGFIERGSDGRFHNTSAFFGRDGTILSTYRKRNLFGIAGDALADSVVHNEASYLSPGSDIKTFDVGGTPFGHSICYDLRFSDHFENLRAQGAKVIMVPAAFTQATGRRDWQRLLQERAIATGAYMVAANQCGLFDQGRFASWGHSMIVDPLGRIVAAAGDTPGILTASLDLRRVLQVIQSGA